MKLTGTNRPITYTTHHPANPFKRGSHPRGGTKKQDCLRPLCGSQTTNPLLENPQLNNNTTVVTPQISHHQAHTARHGTGARVTAVIAWGKRPVPFRTRKLSPPAPMVLHPGGCGRVGHRRHTNPKQGGWERSKHRPHPPFFLWRLPMICRWRPQRSFCWT